MNWENALRILCVRLDNLGDVLMTTPAVHALKHSLAGRHISLLASPSGAALLPLLDDVDDCIVYDAPWVKNDSRDDELCDLAFIERLRAGDYDAAVIFTVYSQSALPAAMMCRLAGIPLVLAHARENPYRLLSHWVADRTPEDGGRHEVQRQLDLVAFIGATSHETNMRMRVLPEHRLALQRQLASLGVPDLSRCIVVHPGASAASRRYPAEKFVQVIRGLGQDPSLRVLVTGSCGEQALAAQICAAAGAHAIDLAGRLSLGELTALIQGAELLVSNNSGPVHIAAAVGTPVVDLYAQTNLQHTPWQVEHRLLFQDVPCKNCYRSVCPEGHHACLAGVPPDSVVAAAFELQSLRRASGEQIPATSSPDFNLLEDTACTP